MLSGILAGICGYVKDEDLTLGVAAGAYLNGRAGELAQENISAVSMLSGDTVAPYSGRRAGDTRGGGRDRIRTPMGRNMI